MGMVMDPNGVAATTAEYRARTGDRKAVIAAYGQGLHEMTFDLMEMGGAISGATQLGRGVVAGIEAAAKTAASGQLFRNSKALLLRNQRSLTEGAGFRWGRVGEPAGLGPGKARVEGLYTQENVGGTTLFQYRNSAGQRMLRVEKGPGFDGGESFWHYHSRGGGIGFKHHRPIFPWDIWRH